MKILMNHFFEISFIKFKLVIVLLIFTFIPFNTAFAWVYSEHRDIALQAVQNLNVEYRADFDQLWNRSRLGFENKLCESAADTTLSQKISCIDWSAFSAIAGDHSCSSTEMLDSILNENWLIEIAKVSAKLKSELAIIPIESSNSDQNMFPDRFEKVSDTIKIHENRAKRLNALRDADIKLLIADSLYATRANANTAHFLIARPKVFPIL